MKKLMIIAMAMLPLATLAANPAARVDTLTVIENPQKVVIVEDPNGMHLQVIGNADDPTALFEYGSERTTETKVESKDTKRPRHLKWNVSNPVGASDSTSHWEMQFGGLYYGWGWPHLKGNNPGFEKTIGSSREFGILYALGVVYNTFTGQRISLGAGIDSRSVYAKDDVAFMKNADDRFIAGYFPEGAKKTSSDIHVTSLQFPITFEQQIYKEISFFASGIMNVSWAWANQKYKVGDAEHKTTIKNIHNRKVTFDLMGGFTFWGISCYVRYRPQSIFKDGYGPKMNQVSMGLMVAF